MLREPQWRVVPDFPNYSVSDTGIVKRTAPVKNNRVRKVPYELSLNKRLGYPSVGLVNEHGTKKVMVHRLVALAFIPNPENKKMVAHKDGSRSNNNVDNLRWSTCKENSDDKDIHGTRPVGTTMRNSKLTEDIVRLCRILNTLGVKSILLSKINGVHPVTMRNAIIGKKWKHV